MSQVFVISCKQNTHTIYVLEYVFHDFTLLILQTACKSKRVYSKGTYPAMSFMYKISTSSDVNTSVRLLMLIHPRFFFRPLTERPEMMRFCSRIYVRISCPRQFVRRTLHNISLNILIWLMYVFRGDRGPEPPPLFAQNLPSNVS
jgi:hypothetical protein